MKRLQHILLNAGNARIQLRLYDGLLKSKPALDERKDILPFFSTSSDLCLLFSHYIPAIKTADRLATEFVIEGDFRADLIVGNAKDGKYLLVEFENAGPNSIFSSGAKAYPDYAKRFEGAFSQLVDWLWRLDDARSTQEFLHVFGRRDVEFTGLIVLGKDMNLDQQELDRLRWRENKVRVDSKAVSVISFDQFLIDADEWLSIFYRV